MAETAPLPGWHGVKRVLIAIKISFAWILRSRAFRVGFSLAASFSLLVWTLLYLDLNELVRVLRGISWAWAAIMFAAMLGYQIFRTARTAMLIGGSRPWHLFNTLCIQTFLNLILPFGLADLALIYLIRVRHETTSHESATSVVLARYIDVTLLCACYSVAFAFEWRNWPWQVMLAIGGLGGGLLLVGLIALLFVRHSGAYAHRFPLPQKLRWHGEKFRDSLAIVIARHKLVNTVLYSAVMWICMYVFFFAAIRALGFALSAISVVLLFVLLDLAAFVPIKGIANVGSHHASWFFALRILRVDTADAMVLGYGTHILFSGSYLAIVTIPILDAGWRLVAGRLAHVRGSMN